MMQSRVQGFCTRTIFSIRALSSGGLEAPEQIWHLGGFSWRIPFWLGTSCLRTVSSCDRRLRRGTASSVKSLPGRTLILMDQGSVFMTSVTLYHFHTDSISKYSCVGNRGSSVWFGGKGQNSICSTSPGATS